MLHYDYTLVEDEEDDLAISARGMLAVAQEDMPISYEIEPETSERSYAIDPLLSSYADEHAQRQERADDLLRAEAGDVYELQLAYDMSMSESIQQGMFAASFGLVDLIRGQENEHETRSLREDEAAFYDLKKEVLSRVVDVDGV